MFLVASSELPDQVYCICTSAKIAKRLATKLAKAMPTHKHIYDNGFSVIELKINEASSHIQVIGEALWHEGKVEWFRMNKPTKPDVFTEFACKLLEKDPVAMDAVRDILKI